MGKKFHYEIPEQELINFCRMHYIKKLSFFGSVLRDDFKQDSDIDILVEFEPEHIPGLIHLSGLENELSGMLKRKVDLRTPEDLSPYFRQDVLNSAEVGYAK